MTATNDDFSPQRVADRLEIQQVVYGFCQAVDRRDFDALDTVFHDDAICTLGPFHGLVSEFIAALKVRHAAIPFSQHHTTNIMMEFFGSDRALVESYLLGWVAAPTASDAPSPSDAPRVDGFSTARFVDLLERRNGRWKIIERTAIAEARADISALPFPVVPGSRIVSGRRDADDLLHQMRRRLALS